MIQKYTRYICGRSPYNTTNFRWNLDYLTPLSTKPREILSTRCSELIAVRIHFSNFLLSTTEKFQVDLQSNVTTEVEGTWLSWDEQLCLKTIACKFSFPKLSTPKMLDKNWSIFYVHLVMTVLNKRDHEAESTLSFNNVLSPLSVMLFKQ